MHRPLEMKLPHAEQKHRVFRQQFHCLLVEIERIFVILQFGTKKTQILEECSERYNVHVSFPRILMVRNRGNLCL